MRNNLFKLILAASIIVVSCGEEQQFFTKINLAEEESTRIRFVHAASDTIGVNLFLDDLKISGAASSTLSTGTVNVGRINFGGDFPVTGYTSLNDGSGNLAMIFPETYAIVNLLPVTYAAKTMSTSAAALDASTWYTVAFVGISPAYETVVYEDELTTAPLDGKAYIRFVNFIHNSTNNVTVIATPLTGDLTPITIAENVAYKEIVNFTGQLPRSYTIKLVDAITPATTLATATAAQGILLGNRVYTLFARGRIGGTGAAAPTFGRMQNR